MSMKSAVKFGASVAVLAWTIPPRPWRRMPLFLLRLFQPLR